MHTYAAMLRAVNVGGTGKLPMDEPIAMCKAAGFGQVRTVAKLAAMAGGDGFLLSPRIRGED